MYLVDVCLFFLNACSYQTPHCNAAESKQLLAESIAETLKKESMTQHDFVSLIELRDIATTNRNEKLDTYSCSATLVLRHPANLTSNLYRMFSNEQDLKVFKQKLQDHFGFVQGKIMSTVTLPAVFGGGIGQPAFNYLLTPTGSDAETKVAALAQIKKILDNDLSQPDSIEIEYDLKQVENHGEMNPYVNWNILDASSFDGYVTFIQFNELLTEMYAQDSKKNE